MWGAVPDPYAYVQLTSYLKNRIFNHSEQLDFEKMESEIMPDHLSKMTKDVVVTGGSDRQVINTQFLSKFILFRKVFLQAFIQNMDYKDMPDEISMSTVLQD